MNNYQPNKHVLVFIKRYSRIGLHGIISDNIKAIIRHREIAWTNSISLDEFVGKTQEAIILCFDSIQNQFELSLRLAERDPWEEAVNKYLPNTEVEGKIVGLIEGAAFVELEPAVEALLPLKELPVNSNQKIEDWLWINDKVKALVQKIDPQKRQLRLSIKSFIGKREHHIRKKLIGHEFENPSKGVTIAECIPNEIRLRLLQIGVESQYDLLQTKLKALIIEDNKTFAIGIKSLLQRNGVDVTLLREDGMNFRTVKSNNKYDIIIMNWNLPEVKGHDIVQELKGEHSGSRYVIMLDASHLDGQKEVCKLLFESGADIISKANTKELKNSLISIVKELRHFKSQPSTQHIFSFQNANVSHQKNRERNYLDADSDSAIDFQERMQNILKCLSDDVGATTSILFSLKPDRPLPILEAEYGIHFPIEKAPPDLIYSPLEDVLQTRQEIILDVAKDTHRFERILEVFSFRGFLGVPIPSNGKNQYGLILFKNKKTFSRKDLQLVHSTINLVAGVIQEKYIVQVFQPWQAQNLLGQLSNNIIHEVNNRLVSLELLVESIEDGLQQITRCPKKAEDASYLHELEQSVEEIRTIQSQASNLKDWYLGLTAEDEIQPINLCTLAKDMMQALRSEAQRNNIILQLKCPQKVPLIFAHPSQVQQIFINLILNAIQQTKELNRIGNIIIEIANKDSNVLQIRFIDDGPGIHTQLWNHIFTFGFTTKKGGAGLGLTISRQIATSLNGRILVESSYMFIGTTFLLELPIGGQGG